MKTLSLTVWERAQLPQCTPPKGTTKQLRQYFKILDALEFSEEEKEEIGYQETIMMTPDGQQVFQANWNPEKANQEFVIVLDDVLFDELYKLFKGFDWPRTRLVLILEDKLDAIKSGIANIPEEKW